MHARNHAGVYEYVSTHTPVNLLSAISFFNIVIDKAGHLSYRLKRLA